MTERVYVKKHILQGNQTLAEENRQRFKSEGVLTINLLSSPGAGKTTLLEHFLTFIKKDLNVAVIEGDVATALDAERIAACGAQAVQINTHGACHLDAKMISQVLDYFHLPEVDLLVIENVGNLVCPAEFDLGEDLRIVLLSTTEGIDKVVKYPVVFQKADAVILNKIDLLPYVTFDLEQFEKDVHELNPQVPIFPTIRKKRRGRERMDELVNGKDPQAVNLQRYCLLVKGIVQGVGFRPFIYRLAHDFGISGHVFNQLGEVLIEGEGPRSQLEAFVDAIQRESLPPIHVESIHKTELEPTGEMGFYLQESKSEGQALNFTIPPDLAICPDCLEDMERPESRYYQYPFTSCTNCGPRYTVTHNLPYDRHHTSMEAFPFCEACSGEYKDPLNRRFHAQTIACPTCGPKVTLVDETGELVSQDWVPLFHTFLRDGKILAVKGIGGFHLVCAAGHTGAVYALRQRKHRPRKPFALMARGIEEIEKYFYVTPREREVLTGTEAPILLLKPKETIKEVHRSGGYRTGDSPARGDATLCAFASSFVS